MRHLRSGNSERSEICSLKPQSCTMFDDVRSWTALKSHDESLQDSSCEVIQSLLSCAQLGTPFLFLAAGNLEGAEPGYPASLATKYQHDAVSSHEPWATVQCTCEPKKTLAIKLITKGPAQTPGQAVGFIKARTLLGVLLLADFQGGQSSSGKLQDVREISNKLGPADVLPQALLNAQRVTARNAW